MSTGKGPEKGQGSRYVVRVFRCRPGERFRVRSLADDYGGLFTHYTSSGSVYCDPAACPAALHKTRRYWKGYTPIEVFERPSGLWVPAVMEITEGMELDLRGVWKRGQEWEVFRARQTTKHKTPIGAKLIGPARGQLPAAFDVLPIVHHLYYVESISLEDTNPLPARVYLEPSTGPAPIGDVIPESGNGSTVKGEQVAEQWKHFMERMRRPGHADVSEN